jgi:hypothetical protein
MNTTRPWTKGYLDYISTKVRYEGNASDVVIALLAIPGIISMQMVAPDMPDVVYVSVFLLWDLDVATLQVLQ